MKKLDLDRITSRAQAEIRAETEEANEIQREWQKIWQQGIIEQRQKEQEEQKRESDIKNSPQYQEMIHILNDPSVVDLLRRAYNSSERYDKHIKKYSTFFMGDTKTKVKKIPHPFSFHKEGPTINRRQTAVIGVSGENSVTASVWCTLGEGGIITDTSGKKTEIRPKRVTISMRWDLNPQNGLEYALFSMGSSGSAYEQKRGNSLEEIAVFLIKFASQWG